MRVAVVGLGDIAQKAYLPVLATTPGLELHLVTRNEQVLADLEARHRPASTGTDLAEVIGRGLDAAFVHAATVAHPDIVGTLLAAGVPTFVDKPLADSYAASATMVEQARAVGVSLMVGFNRRYAPAHVAARALAERDVVVYQKHRPSMPPEQPRRMVFDDFVHVADTVRFLLPGPVTGETITFGGGGSEALEWVSIHLYGKGFSAYGSMHRGSGAAEEVLEVVGGGRKTRVVDLGEVVSYDRTERLTRRPGWDPATRTRGFDAMVGRFLDAVRAGELLDARDALETHALCERVVEAVTAVA